MSSGSSQVQIVDVELFVFVEAAAHNFNFCVCAFEFAELAHQVDHLLFRHFSGKAARLRILNNDHFKLFRLFRLHTPNVGKSVSGRLRQKLIHNSCALLCHHSATLSMRGTLTQLSAWPPIASGPPFASFAFVGSPRAKSEGGALTILI